MGIGDVKKACVDVCARALKTFLLALGIDQAEGVMDTQTLMGLRQANIVKRLHTYHRMAGLFTGKMAEQTKGVVLVHQALASPAFERFVTDLTANVESYHTLSIYPHWHALLSTQLPVSVAEGQSSTTQLTRGWAILQPLLSSEDTVLRTATCHTLKRCCFLSAGVNHKLIDLLLHELPRLEREKKGGAESAYYLMSILIPYKVPGKKENV
jgi:hypothetical protein